MGAFVSTTRIVTNSDGMDFLERSWTAPPPARGTVLLVHGLGEHSGRYEHVGDRLAGIGFDVVAPDLRGFGGSGGQRAHVARFTEYPDDLAPCAARLAAAGIPLVLYGHSLGGLVALLYALGDHPGPDLLILSAPALDATIPAWKRVAARVLGRLAPGIALPNEITGDQLSRDPAVGEAYFADPLVTTRTTARLGAELLAAMAQAREHLSDLTVPTLVLHGGDDTLVPPEVSAPLAERDCVERIVLHGLRHETHNEDGGALALGLITDWLDRRLTGR